jgi:hypothetical protein
MSNIPFNAIGAALSPVQRSNNELVRARKVQSDKNSRHTEDVEELDETAVNSVNDQQQHGNDRQKDRNPRHANDEPEEKVEIAALTDLSPKSAAKPPVKPAKPRAQLDISA